MSKILIVAATAFEIAPVLKHFYFDTEKTGTVLTCRTENIFALITGVGMVNTAYYMGRYAHNHYDYIINAGVCGSFNTGIKIGEVVNVVSDTLSELGAEDGDAFITYENLNLGGTAVYYSSGHEFSPLLNSLKQVSSITVNKVHGHDGSIEKIIQLFKPDVESMEGAAFFRGCENLTAQYFQVRAISNMVEKRDKNKWKMPLAIERLNDFILKFINTLHT